MFILGNFIMAVAKLIDFLFDAYVIIIFARVVISWVNADPYNPIVRFLVQATEPLLSRIRRHIPLLGGLDLSPMILILIIIFLQSLLVPTLQQIGYNLR
ncbi:MAG: YggT family protein [Desulfobulbaceae bacterium]